MIALSVALSALLSFALLVAPAFCDDLAAEADKLYGQGEYEKCFALLEKIVDDEERDNPLMHFYYGKLLMEKKRLEDAKTHLELAKKLHPSGWIALQANALLQDMQHEQNQSITPSLTKGGLKGYIGIQLGKSGAVLGVYADSPAESAHIKKGDKIVSINGKSTPIEYADAARLISGPKGTSVNLVIERNHQRYQCVVTRGAPPPTGGAMSQDKTPVSNSTAKTTIIYPFPAPTVKTSAPPAVSQPAKKIAPDKVDLEIVSIHRKTNDTAAAYDQVIEALHLLPQTLKTQMADGGFRVVITPQIIDAFPAYVNEKPRGYSHGGNYTNCAALCHGKTIYVAERVQLGSSVPQPVFHLVANFMHEFGHAYDHFFHVSDSPEFLKAYELDCQHLTNTLRDQFYYFTQSAETGTGPSEMFAEQTSAYLSPRSYRETFSEKVAKQFPKCAEFVKNRLGAER